MTTLDLNYICSSIGNLSGIPVRLYENNQELHFFSMVKLPKDPMIIYKEKILSITSGSFEPKETTISKPSLYFSRA